MGSGYSTTYARLYTFGPHAIRLVIVPQEQSRSPISGPLERCRQRSGSHVMQDGLPIRRTRIGDGEDAVADCSDAFRRGLPGVWEV